MSTGADMAAAGTWPSMPSFRPWQELLNPAALSLPTSVSAATTRLFQNLSHFLPNYAAVFLLLVFLRLLSHPAAAFICLVISAAWILFLSFPQDEPLLLFGFGVAHGVVLVGLGIVTAVAVVWAGVFWNVVVSAAIGGLVIGLHAVARSTDDLVSDDRGSPYESLVGGGGDNRGTYTIV